MSRQVTTPEGMVALLFASAGFCAVLLALYQHLVFRELDMNRNRLAHEVRGMRTMLEDAKRLESREAEVQAQLAEWDAAIARSAAIGVDGVCAAMMALTPGLELRDFAVARPVRKEFYVEREVGFRVAFPESRSREVLDRILALGPGVRVIRILDNGTTAGLRVWRVTLGSLAWVED